MIELEHDDAKLDIHHIFPKKWCENNGISSRVFNAIVNKTAISSKANRMIGGKAPSQYLAQIQDHAQVKLTNAAMDDILKSHVIDPMLLRADLFQEFYVARKAALLKIVERARGKVSVEASPVVSDDEEDEEEGETT
ncbi:MAG: hypothetical protein FWC18_05050 [Cystobacterineae bacterium]|nr:hypothetical protein [Cystobacterineae bacterium]MCL2259172.1 hypothetical protein [Cystobacterineae bacterium]